MKLKLFIVALYGLTMLALAALSTSTFAYSGPDEAIQSEGERVAVRFDITGRRGLVMFDHKQHEALINPDPIFPHKTPTGVACIGCHHTVKDITDPKDFQKCTNCHKDPGNPINPDDKEGFDLNSMQAFHRLCISCHRASADEDFRAASDRFKAKNVRFANVERTIKFTKCGECHDRDATFTPVAGEVLAQPSPDDSPDFALRLNRAPAPSEIFKTPSNPQLGFSGPSSIDRQEQTSADAVQVPDRWRIGFPDDPRYKRGAWYNPYRQNILKGDYPIFKQHNFMVLTLESETLVTARRIPVPSNVSAQRPDSEEFFGRGGQIFTRENFVASIEIFHGDTSYKPIDWRFRFTPNFNINHLNTQENSLVNINPAFGANRLDGYVGFQELFGEMRLGDTTKLLPFLRGRGSQKGESPYFDTTFIRVGIQQFQSDFRGFIFNDFNLGARLFGQAANNHYNFNAAYFYLLEKDTNSELNTRVNLGEFRDQSLFIANVYKQDTIWKGYQTQFSFHFNNDRPSRHFDENDFLVRPALIGDAAPHGIKSYYLGFTGDGHIGKLNIDHAFYQVLGHDTRNPIAGREVDINAQMAAAELSIDRDWLRFKGSLFFASGDKKPFDGTARGFDSIVDLPEFAGGKFSFWQFNPIPFTNTAVLLTQPESLLPNLRSSKTEGQSNFVNPGIFIYNVGIEAEMTPKLRGILNLNYSHFHHTETLEQLEFQPGIRRDIGIDYGVGVLYRPLLNENIVIAGGFSSLIPGKGFEDIYSSNCSGQNCGFATKTLFSTFVKVKVIY